MALASRRGRTAPTKLGAREWAVDLTLAGLVALAQVVGTAAIVAHRGHHLDGVGLFLLGIAAAALALRRRYPVAVLAVTNVATLAYVIRDESDRGVIWLSVVVAFGTAIYLRRRVEAIVFLVACYVAYLWGPALFGRHRAPSAPFALSLGAGLAAMLAAFERLRLTHQRATAEQLQHAEQLRRRASEERLRIARDLHDVVAHSISVINVHANTALHLMDRQPDRARAALVTINDVSKQALVELRSVLGVLRAVDEEQTRAPAPSLAHLDELISAARAGGLDVEVRSGGTARALPLDVDLAAYRIVQEALTNAVRHSGGTKATVHIEYADAALVVEVSDNGNGRAHQRELSGGERAMGSGIVGMTERASSLGGTLEALRRVGSGFVVRASLPLGSNP